MTSISSSSDPLASLLSALGGSGGSGTSSSGASGTGSNGTSGNGLISAPGIGSGLDVNTIVSQLVQAEKAPAQNQIDSQRANLTTQTSALGTLKSLLASLQSSLASLANGSAFTAYTATSSDTDSFTATAGASAMPGSYQIDVQQLAAAQKLTSGAFASAAAVGTGTLTIAVGSASINVDIDSTNNTLAGIRDAINNASGNPGVSATIVHATDGDHLVLNSTQTGVANAFSISTSGGDGGLDALTWDAATSTGNLTQQTAASDAKVDIDGFTSTSSNNVIAGAIDGITLNLASANPGDTQTLTVGRDNASIQNVVQGFVTAYNNFAKGAAQLASYDPVAKTAGPMLGNSTLMNIRSQLAMTLTNVVSGNSATLNTLAAIGIQMQADGTLQVNSGTLSAALNNQPDQAASLFDGTSGYGTKLNSLLTGYLGSGGLLDNINSSLTQQGKQLDQQQSSLDDRMQSVQKRYMAQFTALDVTMSQMNQTSTFLTSQLSMLSNMYKPSSN